ncbi:FHA domain-containing protein [Candidatus Woesearchaeota archaeon]|nr:FHA domain-containing protein [Candidatus Woesearchaeota archaeon]
MQEFLTIETKGRTDVIDITDFTTYKIGWPTGQYSEYPLNTTHCPWQWTWHHGKPRRVPRLSRRHAELRLEQGQRFICDLGSREGTYLNDERISERGRQGSRALEHGDVIGLSWRPLRMNYVVTITYQTLTVPAEEKELLRARRE